MPEEKKGVLVRVTPELHRKLKIYSFNENISIQNYVLGLIEKDIKEHSNKCERIE